MSVSANISNAWSSLKRSFGRLRAASFWRSPLLRELLITIVLALVVYFGLNLSLQNAIVVGRSMEPNLQNNERVLINKLAYRFWGSPKRGDIIVFEPPSQVAADQDYVKRIIGLPGESVVIQNGYVAIILADGTEVRLDESDYLNQPTIGSYHSGVIPEGYYFVLGDNRSNSGDSRQGWLVAKSAIVGKAWLVIWPPSEWGLAPNRKPGVG